MLGCPPPKHTPPNSLSPFRRLPLMQHSVSKLSYLDMNLQQLEKNNECFPNLSYDLESYSLHRWKAVFNQCISIGKLCVKSQLESRADMSTWRDYKVAWLSYGNGSACFMATVTYSDGMSWKLGKLKSHLLSFIYIA